jgi:hypothetical protein
VSKAISVPVEHPRTLNIGGDQVPPLEAVYPKAGNKR